MLLVFATVRFRVVCRRRSVAGCRLLVLALFRRPRALGIRLPKRRSILRVRVILSLVIRFIRLFRFRPWLGVIRLMVRLLVLFACGKRVMVRRRLRLLLRCLFGFRRVRVITVRGRYLRRLRRRVVRFRVHLFGIRVIRISGPMVICCELLFRCRFRSYAGLPC